MRQAPPRSLGILVVCSLLSASCLGRPQWEPPGQMSDRCYGPPRLQDGVEQILFLINYSL